MTDNDIIYAVVFSTLVILLLIAGVAITIFIANKQRIIQEVKIAGMRLDYEKEMRKVQHEVQEQVLANVSRELHDNIGQLLTVMHIQMEQRKMKDPELTEKLTPLRDTLSSVIKEVRALSRSLNSDLLEQNGLLNTIAAEVLRLQQFNDFAIEWVTDDTEPGINKDQRLMAFRIFQEITNNILKHAEATKISISLTGKDKFALVVQDDGLGFDTKEIYTGNGSGLKNIMKRAGLANLKCGINSKPGNGSIFTLEVSNALPS